MKVLKNRERNAKEADYHENIYGMQLLWSQCKKAPEILQQAGAEAELIHSVCSHAYGVCNDVEPKHEMEKVLFAADELTGLIWAASLMRPSKSVSDMEISSVKKKFKDKRFASGCSREVIREGAERLGWELGELFEKTLQAMKEGEEEIKRRCTMPIK